MPGSRASVFGEAEDFQAALSTDGVAGMLFTGRGPFRARLTQIELERLRLAVVEEAQSRIAFVVVPTGRVLVSFLIDRGPAPVWAGNRAARRQPSHFRLGRAVPLNDSRALSLGHHSNASTPDCRLRSRSERNQVGPSAGGAMATTAREVGNGTHRNLAVVAAGCLDRPSLFFRVGQR